MPESGQFAFILPLFLKYLPKLITIAIFGHFLSGKNHLIFTGGGGGGTSFEMMHAFFFQGTIVCKQFFSDVTVSNNFFPGKFLG